MYNILCDSVGLEPSPNNGTLRLPLKTDGLHDEVPAVEIPSDPVTSYTITSTYSTTTTPAPTLTPTPSSSKSLGIDPVVTDEVSVPVGVDAPGQPGDENKKPAAEEEEAKAIWDWAKDQFGKAWSWTTDKAGEVWGKIQGGSGAENTQAT